MNHDIIPTRLYSAEQIRRAEKKLAKLQGVTLYQLMETAGQAVFDLLLHHYPHTKKLLVCCGKGNNGGDGYVVARLALQHGVAVTVWDCSHGDNLAGDAATARDHWLACSGVVVSEPPQPDQSFDLIVDALLGTGLRGAVRSELSHTIEWVNQALCPVIAVDVPSGLCADTGFVPSVVVKADMTLSFIGFKLGLVTGQAAEYCGKRYFSALGIGKDLAEHEKPMAVRLDTHTITSWLPPRSRVAHKGNNGRVLCIGGDSGMGGAIRLCSEACARTGAGLTSVVTQPENVLSIVTARPEIMVSGWKESLDEVGRKLEWADVLIIGPGLGQSDWSKALFTLTHNLNMPCVLDADGLNLLAMEPCYQDNRIITPHPGEAARLLKTSISQIEIDRFSAVKKLQQTYGGVAILKGSGTLIYDGQTLWVCTAGNPGMASGGMGDVLSGIIGALLGQGLSLSQAACTGVWIHSKAADLCAQSGERGMLAADLFPFIRQLVNPR